MSKNLQKSSLLKILMVIVLIGALVYGGYALFIKDSKTSSNSTQNSQNQPNGDKQAAVQQTKDYTDNENGFSFKFEKDREPKVTVTPVSDFKLLDLGGWSTVYDQTKKVFIKTNKSGTVAQKIEPATKAGDVYIFLHKKANGGNATDTYFILLKNNKVLQAEYSHEHVTSESGRSETDIEAQRAKDLKSIQTFKFL